MTKFAEPPDIDPGSTTEDSMAVHGQLPQNQGDVEPAKSAGPKPEGASSAADAKGTSTVVCDAWLGIAVFEAAELTEEPAEPRLSYPP